MPSAPNWSCPLSFPADFRRRLHPVLVLSLMALLPATAAAGITIEPLYRHTPGRHMNFVETANGATVWLDSVPGQYNPVDCNVLAYRHETKEVITITDTGNDWFQGTIKADWAVISRWNAATFSRDRLLYNTLTGEVRTDWPAEPNPQAKGDTLIVSWPEADQIVIRDVADPQYEVTVDEPDMISVSPLTDGRRVFWAVALGPHYDRQELRAYDTQTGQQEVLRESLDSMNYCTGSGRWLVLQELAGTETILHAMDLETKQVRELTRGPSVSFRDLRDGKLLACGEFDDPERIFVCKLIDVATGESVVLPDMPTIDLYEPLVDGELRYSAAVNLLDLYLDGEAYGYLWAYAYPTPGSAEGVYCTRLAKFTIPEPATLLLLGAGGAALAAIRRRRRQGGGPPRWAGE